MRGPTDGHRDCIFIHEWILLELAHAKRNACVCAMCSPPQPPMRTHVVVNNYVDPHTLAGIFGMLINFWRG